MRRDAGRCAGRLCRGGSGAQSRAAPAAALAGRRDIAGLQYRRGRLSPVECRPAVLAGPVARRMRCDPAVEPGRRKGGPRPGQPAAGGAGDLPARPAMSWLAPTWARMLVPLALGLLAIGTGWLLWQAFDRWNDRAAVSRHETAVSGSVREAELRAERDANRKDGDRRVTREARTEALRRARE